MNICFLLGGFTGSGGIGRVTSILVNTLCKDEKYNIYTLSYFNNQKDNLYRLDNRICQDYLFKKPINMTKGILTGGILKLRKYLKENHIDVLIACGALYYPISVLSCKGIETKCICWEHSNVHNSKDHAFQLLCRRFGVKNADLIVTLTKHDQKSHIDKYHIDNVAQIYNPIDEDIFKYTHKYRVDSRKLLSVGRLSYQKNFGMLIEIAREVLSNNPNWTWDIYGEGDLKDELQSKIIKYGLKNRLVLKGQVNNLYSLYNKYAVLIMTSRYEGFPMVLLEASANKLPLISFDVLTGPNEIIEHGSNGFLIKPFDINQMIECIEIIICNKELRCKMSQNSYKTSDRFNANAIVHEWTKLI